MRYEKVGETRRPTPASHPCACRRSATRRPTAAAARWLCVFRKRPSLSLWSPAPPPSPPGQAQWHQPLRLLRDAALPAAAAHRPQLARPPFLPPSSSHRSTSFVLVWCTMAVLSWAIPYDGRTFQSGLQPEPALESKLGADQIETYGGSPDSSRDDMAIVEHPWELWTCHSLQHPAERMS